ncbi:Uncharacterized protein APZ42_030220 [Daphnia magna]|uniref:Reverse transcriptase domain-containing protein n=1 Tax=Daphnia magna TaxID=35525 RepID=A0A164NYN9_9CRUS|nr:Uncharacterized protein APZ42_030220 [Daphnia magna]
MAFGLSPAPRIFTKLLKVVTAILRQQGLRLVIFLDDILILNSTEGGVRNDLKTTLDLLQSLGFLVNWEKSVVAPSQIMEYLGMIVDSIKMSFSLPAIKVQEVKRLCEQALEAKCVSLRSIASILGNFTWAIPTIPYAQSHYRSMQRFYLNESRRASGNLNTKRALSPEAEADLRWWLSNLEVANGKVFFPKSPDIEICSDASLSGWGAVCNGVATRGPWTVEQLGLHINCLELLGALFALKSFVGASHRLSVKMYLDNSTAVCYINKGGGTRSAELTSIAKLITDFCEQRQLSIEAVHLAGALNIEADAESRSGPDASDWVLNRDVFRNLREIWPMDVDLFGSFWNAQLPRYVSWRPQPEAMAVNAFSVNWGDFVGYVFPPFSMIPKCLEKIRREKANVIMICPVWPAQPWYPVMLEMVCETPRLLHPSIDLLMSPQGEPHPLLESGTLQLAAWKFKTIDVLMHLFFSFRNFFFIALPQHPYIN